MREVDSSHVRQTYNDFVALDHCFILKHTSKYHHQARRELSRGPGQQKDGANEHVIKTVIVIVVVNGRSFVVISRGPLTLGSWAICPPCPLWVSLAVIGKRILNQL